MGSMFLYSLYSFSLILNLSPIILHYVDSTKILIRRERNERPQIVSIADDLEAPVDNFIHHFLYLKMPVTSQEYDSSCPFVFNVFCYLILPCDYGLSD